MTRIKPDDITYEIGAEFDDKGIIPLLNSFIELNTLSDYVTRMDMEGSVEWAKGVERMNLWNQIWDLTESIDSHPIVSQHKMEFAKQNYTLD